MSRIPGDAILRALDANGEPVAGALLRVYIANTTTPVTTYSDRLLTTPQAFPVVADSSGVFPPVYAVSGNLKLSMQTPAGVELPGFPVDNVQNDPGNGLDFAFLSPTVSTFTADGTVGPFTLAGNASATAGMTQVHVAGVRVPAADYTIADDELTFGAGKAPPNATPVEVISFGAFGADVLVTPVGHEQAALSAHLGEALTGVRTPTLTITGTEVVQSPAVILQRIIAADDFTGTDAEKMNKAVAALGTRGGSITLLPRQYNCAADVIIDNKPIRLIGAANPAVGGKGTELRFTDGAAALRLRRATGSRFEHVRIEQTATTGRAVSFDAGQPSGSSYVSFQDCTIIGGNVPLYVANVLEIRLDQCRIIGTANNQIVVHLDGTGGNVAEGDGGVDAVEFVQTVIATTSARAGDVIVGDGNAASIKFTDCPILWGQRGIVARNSASNPSNPRFWYFKGGGFENQGDYSLLIDAGSLFQFSTFYMSNSSDVSGKTCIRLGSAAGDVDIAGAHIRAGARHNIEAVAGSLTVTGCHIGNAGRVDGTGTSLEGQYPSAIRLAGAAKAVITGNVLGPMSDGIGTRQHHGVRFSSLQTAPVIVAHNDMRGQKTSSFSGSAPAGSVVANNLVDP